MNELSIAQFETFRSTASGRRSTKIDSSCCPFGFGLSQKVFAPREYVLLIDSACLCYQVVTVKTLRPSLTHDSAAAFSEEIVSCVTTDGEFLQDSIFFYRNKNCCFYVC